MPKRLVVDLDGTLTIDEQGIAYRDRMPNIEVISKLRAYKLDGFVIVICTARNMNTYSGSIGMINVNTLPIVIDWLERYNIPYDEIYVGKPWCGYDGFYIDDKAVRPSEFARMSYVEIRELLAKETRPVNPTSEEVR